jgi:phage-related minor tail protein
LRKFEGRGGFLSGAGRGPDIGTGFYSAAEIEKKRQLLESLLEAEQGTARSGPRNRGRFTPSPGFDTAADKKTTSTSGGPQLSEVYIRESYRRITTEQERFAEINRETTAQVQEDVQSVINSYGDVSEAVRDGWIKSVAEASQVTSEWSAFAEQAARNIQDSFAQFLFDPFEEGVNGMLAGFLDTVRQMVAQLASQELLRAFFGWAGGAIGGGVGSFLSGLAPRAMGGPVTAGGAYLVGERGPEMFVPRSSGTIIPNGGGAPVTVNYSIDARGADASRIMAILPGMLEQTKRQTVAEVIRLQRQGRFA